MPERRLNGQAQRALRSEASLSRDGETGGRDRMNRLHEANRNSKPQSGEKKNEKREGKGGKKRWATVSAERTIEAKTGRKAHDVAAL